jgi:hypothetical protein
MLCNGMIRARRCLQRCDPLLPDEHLMISDLSSSLRDPPADDLQALDGPKDIIIGRAGVDGAESEHGSPAEDGCAEHRVAAGDAFPGNPSVDLVKFPLRPIVRGKPEGDDAAGDP